MKRILILNTGGTFSSQASGHGLAPSISGDEIINKLGIIDDDILLEFGHLGSDIIIEDHLAFGLAVYFKIDYETACFYRFVD